MRKRIEIYFANPLVSMSDHKSDIMTALKHASHNLYSRHGIDMKIPSQDLNSKAIVILDGDMDATFNVGRHLKGVSTYLLKRCKYPYKQHRIGTRLLYYCDVTDNRKEYEHA